MATTRVTRDQLQCGDLPPVCVVTGEDADGLVQATLTHTPAWPWLILLLLPLAAGFAPLVLLVVLVCFWSATERLPARLPFTEAALARFHRTRRISGRVIAASVAVLVVVIAVAGEVSTAVATTAATAAVLTLVGGTAARLSLVGRIARPRPERDRVHVTLRGVPTRFAEEVAKRLPVTTG